MVLSRKNPDGGLHFILIVDQLNKKNKNNNKYVWHFQTINLKFEFILRSQYQQPMR